MSVLAPEQANEIIAGWRSSTEPTHGVDNPAGELYASGIFAEADIVQVSAWVWTNGSPCSTARGVCCC